MSLAPLFPCDPFMLHPAAGERVQPVEELLFPKNAFLLAESISPKTALGSSPLPCSGHKAHSTLAPVRPPEPHPDHLTSFSSSFAPTLTLCLAVPVLSAEWAGNGLNSWIFLNSRTRSIFSDRIFHGLVLPLTGGYLQRSWFTKFWRPLAMLLPLTSPDCFAAVGTNRIAFPR